MHLRISFIERRLFCINGFGCRDNVTRKVLREIVVNCKGPNSHSSRRWLSSSLSRQAARPDRRFQYGRGTTILGISTIWKKKSMLFISASTLAFLELSIPQQDLHESAHHHSAPQTTLIPSVKESSGIRRLLSAITRFFKDYIYEPLRTGLRFVHLTMIFLPVIITAPAILFGDRDAAHDYERSGTLWWYSFLVKRMEDAGPTFIKLAQWAASRTDIFPIQLCSRMSKMHSNVDAHPFNDTEHAVEKSFDGRTIEQVFEEIDEIPIGIGAIAQVYKARLKPDLVPPALNSTRKPNKEKLLDFNPKHPPHVPTNQICIKVLHPYAKKMIERDLKIMGFFARLLDMIPCMSWLSFPDEVRTFGYLMQMQLDLRIEAEHLEKFEENFRNRPTVVFPRPLSEYATEELMAEEYIYGVPLGAFLENGAGPYSKRIASVGLDAFLNMLLKDNFIHADLHPGNILVRFYKTTTTSTLKSVWQSIIGKGPEEPAVYEDGVTRLRSLRKDKEAWSQELERLHDEGFHPEVVFIDAGLVTSLNSINRRNFIDLFRAVAEFDGYRAGKLMIERCRTPELVVQGEIFALKMQHLVLRVKSQTFSLAKIHIGDILRNVLSMVRSHHVRLEGDFINVVISMLLLEGIGRQLDPDTDLFASALPVLRQIGAAGGAKGALESLPSRETNWLFKTWFLMEARQFASDALADIDHLVKADLLSPNI